MSSEVIFELHFLIKPHTMKTIITTLTFLFVSFFNLDAQILPNGDFESWVTIPVWEFEEPEDWITSNLSAVPLGLPANATKVTDAHSGNYALKLETINDPASDVILGGAVCGTQVTGKPNKVTGYYKADIKGIDIPGMFIVLVKNGMPIGEAEFEFESKSNWTYFEMIINYNVPNQSPEEFTLSIFTTENDPSVGTALYLDDMTFDGVNPTVDIYTIKNKLVISPNPSYEKVKIDLDETLLNLNIVVLDIMGKSVLVTHIDNHSFLDISTLNCGSYLLKVEDSRGNLLASKKIQVLE